MREALHERRSAAAATPPCVSVAQEEHCQRLRKVTRPATNGGPWWPGSRVGKRRSTAVLIAVFANVLQAVRVHSDGCLFNIDWVLCRTTENAKQGGEVIRVAQALSLRHLW